MTEPPRRLDPTPAQRVEMAIERSAGGVAGSGTRYSRPIPNGGNRSYAHGIPAGGDSGQGLVKLSDDDYDVDWGSSGGGITAFARYDDEAVPSTSTVYVIDPSSLGDSEGDAGSYFAYNNAGFNPGVQMTSLGWYQVFVHLQVDPITAGSVVHVRIHWPTAGFDTDAYAVDFGAGVSLSALTLPSKNYDTDGLITVTVDNPAGGTINTAQVHVLKWPGV